MNTPHDPGRVPLQQLLGRLADDLQAQPVPPPPAWGLPSQHPPIRSEPPPRPGAPAWHGRHPGGGARSRLGLGWPLAWGGALACVLVLLGAGWLMVQLPPGLGTETMAAETRPLRETGFVPVAEPDRWVRLDDPGAVVRADTGTGSTVSQVAQAAWVVRTELPAERLALLGLPYDPGRAARPVQAELLLHASGDVLAVRVLP